MANIKSAKKRIKVTEAKTAKNKMIKSGVKTAVKKVSTGEDKKIALSEATKKLDMAVAKGVMHKNTAARQKSRLSKIVQKAN